MKSALLLSTCLLCPVVATAQAVNSDSANTPTRFSTQVAATQPRTPPPPRTDVMRRRPSMVGYIEDAVIGSRIRLRFDAGFHSTVPDRAEFFYAKCGCFRDLSPSLPVFDPDAAGPGPGVTTDVNFQQLYLEAEYSLGSRVSLFGTVPVRWLQPQVFVPDIEGRFGTFGNHSGLSDIRAGVKLGLSTGDSHAVTAQVQAFLPTGDSFKGLGTNHATIEPALLYFQRLSDRVAVESEFGAWLPTSGSPGVPTASSDKFSGNVVFYGVGPSVTLVSTEAFQFTPVLELVGWRILSGFQTASVLDAGDTNIVNLKVGARLGFGEQSSVYVGYGHALTDADWYDDILRLEYRVDF